MLYLERLSQYGQLMRINRPIGILLLLWPTLWAVWLAANGHPSIKCITIFTIGVCLMRSAGCIVNDFADQQFDGLVKRTKQRPLVTKQVSNKEAIILFAILCILASTLLLFMNLFTFELALPGLLLVLIYPYMKRYMHLPQAILGMAFSWGILMAYSAQQNTVPLNGWLLFLASAMWAMVYDTEYAMVDREDDITIGVKSTAILFGKHDRCIIALFQSLILATLLCLGKRHNFHLSYYLFQGLAFVNFLYQQWLIRHRKPTLCFQAFLTNNWFGFFVFLGFATA